MRPRRDEGGQQGGETCETREEEDHAAADPALVGGGEAGHEQQQAQAEGRSDGDKSDGVAAAGGSQPQPQVGRDEGRQPAGVGERRRPPVFAGGLGERDAVGVVGHGETGERR